MFFVYVTAVGPELEEIASFMESLPYNERTVFGFVTMFDPRQHIKEAVFKEKDGISFMGLEDGENLTLDYLIKGRYYSHTGIKIHNIQKNIQQQSWNLVFGFVILLVPVVVYPI